MILVIDNYDSFIYNVVQYVGEFYPDIQIFRNNKITLAEALAMEPCGIIISPGPGRPEDSKISLELIKNCGDIPLFGVCLGHQGIAIQYGGIVVGAKNIMHGKSSTITHNSKGLFAGIDNPFKAIRYHSLVAKRDTLPENLEITAESEDGEIMGLKVKDRDIYGVQFHPESILTEHGKALIKNFVDLVEKKKNERIGGKIKTMLSRVTEGQNLSKDEATEMMRYIMKGMAKESQIASYLTALKIKGETPDEIAGSSEAMFGACVQVKTDLSPIIDTCGTGGDKSGTFNISTAVSFVVAGAGVGVAKHGNRSITSKSGSADVLEKLGVNIHQSAEEASRCLSNACIAFMFAPDYHPAMKYVMPVRRDLGFRTIFNILGPITNPAGVKRHIMGVFSRELLELLPEVFVKLGHLHTLVVHGEGGLDEATIEGKTYIKEIKEGTVSDLLLDAADFGLDGKLSSLKVNNATESQEMILRVLKGTEKGAPRKAVVLNAGLALYIAKNLELHEAFRQAEDSIDSGNAAKALELLVEHSNLGKLAV